ncbi:MAG: nucleoside-diphosphate kinase [Candidatus Micrarchaeota archaeon]
MMQQTVVLFKPDAMQRGVCGKIYSRLEEKGLNLVAAKLIKLDDALLDIHYEHHKGKPFFPRLKDFMKSAPVLAMVWEGYDAVKVVRDLVGPTNGRAAPAGTIRGDFSISQACNLVHASDSVETAAVEIKRFFTVKEIHSWQKKNVEFVYSPEELKG